MSRIPQTFIDDLLSRLDIVNIVDSRVKLKKTGKNYAACCPFHQEKTPSFTVSPDKQFYYCFGCGASGNALGFVMEYEREGFIEAVESLAKTAGMEVPREQNVEFAKQDFRRRKLFDTLEAASEFYQDKLKTHPQKHNAVKYLKGRGLSGQIAKDFGIGFAPPGRDNLLSSLGKNNESESLLIDSGLVIHKEEENKKYDRFRYRITFPIRDTRGRVIGFGGRVLGDDKPKYLNSPETDVFHKSQELYGLYEACKQRDLSSLIVVEGYMDVIALAQFDIRNAVATLGTACGEDHLKLAFRYVSEIIFCFDGDNAGRKAALRAFTNSLSSMEDGRQIKFLFLAEGQDPDSLVRQIGRDRFIEQTGLSIPLEEFLFDVAAEGIDIKSMDGRARFSKTAAPLIAKLPQGIFRELMFDNLARRTGLSREVLDELQNEKILLLEAQPKREPQPRKELRPGSEPQPKSAPQPNLETKAQIQPQPKEQSHAANETQLENEPSRNNTTDSDPGYQNAPYPEPYPDQIPPADDQSGYANRPPTQLNLRPQRKPTVELSAAEHATIILLEDPSLLSKLETPPQIEAGNDPDLLCLSEVINYLQKRPNSNFNNILGFWGGAKGIKQQQKLAKLMANQLLSTAKTINTYDSLSELSSTLETLSENHSQRNHQQELSTLKAIGLKNLSSEQKKRLIELSRS